MKILHVINSLHIGGAEKLLVDLSPRLRERGHSVEVLLLDGTMTHFRRQLEALEIVVHHLGEGNSVYSPWNILQIARYIRHCDIIHVHLFPAQYWVPLAKLLAFSSVKLITTEHCADNRRRKIRWFRPLDRFFYSCFSRIICVSAATRDALASYLGNERRMSVILNGIDLNAFRTAKPLEREELRIPADGKLLIQVARFDAQKDQDTLIKATACLSSNFRLALVGDGVRRQACEQLASELGIANRVHFLGIRQDVPRILKTADIIVMSSHFEGLSLSSIEGMCVGKPFIASDVPGLHEMVKGSGLLFKAGDSTGLSALIQTLTTDSNLCSNVANSCMQRATQFDIERVVEAYESIYRST